MVSFAKLQQLIGSAVILSADCILAVPTVAQEQNLLSKERIPLAHLQTWKKSPTLVGSPSLAWTDRKIITVAFEGGDDQIRGLIEKTAMEWLQPDVDVQFSFRNKSGKWREWSQKDLQPRSAIRIGFSTAADDGGYWSVIGRMATIVPAGQQTMNLGDLLQRLQQYGGGTSREWMASYDRAVISHEFGHALGVSHEHFHPDCQADLKIAEAVNYLMGPPNNWSEEQARFNVEAAFYFEYSKTRQDAAFPGQDNNPTVSAQIDRASTMLYAFDPDIYYKSGEKSPCNPSISGGYATTPSAGDLEAFRMFYPKKK